MGTVFQFVAVVFMAGMLVCAAAGALQWCLERRRKRRGAVDGRIDRLREADPTEALRFWMLAGLLNLKNPGGGAMEQTDVNAALDALDAMIARVQGNRRPGPSWSAAQRRQLVEAFVRHAYFELQLAEVDRWV